MYMISYTQVKGQEHNTLTQQPHYIEREVITMKQLTNYQRVAGYLAKIFRAINAEYFDNELETPTITIQSTVGAYGHISTRRIWDNGDGTSFELNIGADYLSRKIEEIVSTLEHESIHLYCLQNDIKDTSNRGVYHNKTFKKLAEEKCGLIIERHDKYGYTLTYPSDETIRFCLEHNLEDIQINRNTGYTMTGIGTPKAGSGNGQPKVKKPSSTRKYICPCCGNSFRATKNLNVMCMDCNEQFVLAD